MASRLSQRSPALSLNPGPRLQRLATAGLSLAVQMRKITPKPAEPEGPEEGSLKTQRAKPPAESRHKLSPSQAAWLLVCKPADLKPEQKAAVDQMRTASSSIALAHDLAQDFAILLREHQAERLAPWLETAKKTCLAELRSFAHGIERDMAAVMAGIALEWSNGQVEGQVNRLKFIKCTLRDLAV